MPKVEVSSPNKDAAGQAVDGGAPAVDGPAAATKTKGKKKWFKEMRGWIMMLAAQVAAFTYQAGLDPPGRFSETESSDETEDPLRFKVFFYSNTMAFLTSLAIIILLMNRSFYRSIAKVTVLEIIVVLDMIGLMAAYWAGSTCKKQTNMVALVLTVLVLFVIYVVYAVQLVQKLWDLFLAVQRPVPAAPARAANPDDDGTPPVPNQQGIVHGTQAPPTLDIDRSKSELRRRDSRLVAQTPGTGQSTMLSP